MIGSQEAAHYPNAFLDEVDGRASELKVIKTAQISLQHEAAVAPQQPSGFVDRLTDQSVASMARAARSGSSAWVMGRPITRIEAP